MITSWPSLLPPSVLIGFAFCKYLLCQHAAKPEALPKWEHQMLNMEGDTAAYSGHLKAARLLSRRAMDNAQHGGEKDAPALYSGTSGLREAWFGNTDEAQRRVTWALRLSTSRDLLYFAALAFAYVKDDARAKALADNVNKMFPEVGSVKDIQAHLRHSMPDTTANEYMLELPESVQEMVGSVYAMLRKGGEKRLPTICHKKPQMLRPSHPLSY